MCFVCSAMTQKFWDSGVTHGGLMTTGVQNADFQTGGPSGQVGSAFLTGGLTRTVGGSGGDFLTGGPSNQGPGLFGDRSPFSTGGLAQGQTTPPVSEEATATSQGSTGVQNVDALLGGNKWSGSSLTYMFPDTTSYFNSSYYDQNALQGFAVATAAQQTAAKAAFAAISGFTNMNFSEVLASNITGPYTPQVDITIARSSYPGTAYAYYPYTDQVGGDVWMGINGGNSNPVKGNYAWHTMWHELGHALGLKHGHETGGVTNQALTSDRDGMEFSVMTYRSYIGSSTSGGYTNETWGYAQSFMMYDIAALQAMYGADFTTNSSNTTYTFSSTTGEMFINGVGQGAAGGNRIFLTIWDGGGTDTYDFSNYTTNQSIDLTPGSWSLMSEAQRANLGSGNYARANVYNALQYGTDTRSLIENAIGGSGNDTITGNAANNELKGGGGTDTLYGGDGSDTLWGDAGGDTLDGGQGDDTFYFDLTDTLVGGSGNDTAILLSGSGRGYNAIAASIETLRWTESGNTITAVVTGGAYTETATDTAAAQTWASYSNEYTSSWIIKQSNYLMDDGTRRVSTYDHAGANAWHSYTDIQDTLGRIDLQNGTWDTGATWIVDFDETNSTNLAYYRNEYDTLARYDFQTGLRDDGTTWLLDYDQANATDLNYFRIEYDSLGRYDFQNGLRDDGTTWFYDVDQANAGPLAHYRIEYDTLGRISFSYGARDDGTLYRDVYDPANTSDYIQYRIEYDTLGRVDYNFGSRDNGTSWWLDYDQANIYSYASYQIEYDTAGRADFQTGIFDDGRTWYRDYDQLNQFSWAERYVIYSSTGTVLSETFI